MVDDLLRKSLEFLEGCDPSLTSGGHKNQALRGEIRARLSQAGAGGAVDRDWGKPVRDGYPTKVHWIKEYRARTGTTLKLSLKAYDSGTPMPDLAALAPSPSAGEPVAWKDVLAERRRQVEGEGWTPEHDDQHSRGEMAKAAACYAAGSTLERELSPEERRNLRTKQTRTGGLWPWGREWWKPSDQRRNLVKAGALILAEIERLDRKIVCQTCDGHGLIGGWRVGDGYDAEPCPDYATPSATPVQPIASVEGVRADVLKAALQRIGSASTFSINARDAADALSWCRAVAATALDEALHVASLTPAPTRDLVDAPRIPTCGPIAPMPKFEAHAATMPPYHYQKPDYSTHSVGMNQSPAPSPSPVSAPSPAFEQARQDAAMFGSGWVQFSPDGTTVRVDPSRIAIRVLSSASAPSPAGGVREALEAADRLETLAFSKQMSQRPLNYEQVETIFKAVSTIRAALSSPATPEPANREVETLGECCDGYEAQIAVLQQVIKDRDETIAALRSDGGTE